MNTECCVDIALFSNFVFFGVALYKSDWLNFNISLPLSLSLSTSLPPSLSLFLPLSFPFPLSLSFLPLCPPLSLPLSLPSLSDSGLLVRACNLLGGYLTNHKDPNLKYLSLEGLCSLATSEFSHEAVKKHQDTVLHALKVRYSTCTI